LKEGKGIIMAKKKSFTAAILFFVLLTAFGTSVAQAYEVFYDPANPSTVIGIENLEVEMSLGITVYDVDFRYEKGEAVYGENLDDFPFNSERDAIKALIAISNALNSETPKPRSAGAPDQGTFYIGIEAEALLIGAVGNEFRDDDEWGTCELPDCFLGAAILPSHSVVTYADITEADSAGNKPPVADAGGPYTADVDVAVAFDGTVSSDPDGDLVLGTWDFGDGTTGSGEAPSHAYSAAGVYYVTLAVTDDSGAIDSDGTVAVIGLGAQPPVADPGGPYMGAVDAIMTLNGTGSSDPDGSIMAYDWDFGDGNIGSGATPSHGYSASGIYYVTLMVTDDSGEIGSNVTVAVIGSGNQPLVADAGGPYTAEVDVAVAFDGTGSSDPDGSIVAYDWDFGDGSIGSGATPSHAYSATGVYNATLAVTDDAGATDSDGTVVVVELDPGDPDDPGDPKDPGDLG
jgi:PKD repeat protein